MKKIISIIIATYNASKTLKRCLDSIISQKTDGIEILVIDGFSTDSTMKIVKSFGERIDYSISEKDKGIYDAWNKGVNVAHGDWIMFLGADDYLLDGSIKLYMNYLSNGDYSNMDIISARCKYVKDGRFIDIRGEKYDYKTFCRYMNISHGSTLHNRNLFVELGKFDLSYRICADYEFLLRKVLIAEFINSPTFCMEAGGMSCSARGLVETYRLRRQHKTIPLSLNCYLFIKGLGGLYYRKLLNRQ